MLDSSAAEVGVQCRVISFEIYGRRTGSTTLIY
jgi:hypothetical protein